MVLLVFMLMHFDIRRLMYLTVERSGSTTNRCTHTRQSCM